MVSSSHWLESFSPKSYFFDILEIFILEMGQISSDLLKKAFVTWWCAFLSTFFDIVAWACTEIKICKIISPRHGVAMCTCSRWQFCSEVSSQIFEHCCVYFRLPWAIHFDLGITGKIFSSCRTWVQMTPILGKVDGVRRETKANACHSQLWSARELLG